MLPYVSIGDVYLPFFSIGFSITCLIFLFTSFKSLKEFGLDDNDAMNIPTIVCISSIIFSKIPLGLIYKWKISDYFVFWKTGHTLIGGMLISTLAIIIYSKARKIDFIKIVAGLTHPTFFALSAYRLFVCFMVGCCYGIESQKYGLNFHPESFAVKGVKLFPSQLVESFLFLASGITIYKLRKKIEMEKLIVLGIYLLILERIIAEQIRSDIKEKIINIEGFGLSIWFFFLILILIITDTYLNIFRVWVSEIKNNLVKEKK